MKGLIIRLNKHGIGWIDADDGSGFYMFYSPAIDPAFRGIKRGSEVIFDRAADYKENFATNLREPAERNMLMEVIRKQVKEKFKISDNPPKKQ